MKILAIETSCDETAVCMIEATGDIGADFSFEVLGNALYSQVAIHAPYGGVFPNLAKREHAKNLIPLLTQVFDQANIQQSHKGRSFVISENGSSKDFFDPKGPTYVKVSEMLSREAEMLEHLIAFLEKYDKPNIDAIAVTHGPGLEPALWVGVNLARVLSLIWDIPLIAVNHMEGHIVMSTMKGGTFEDFQFPLLSLLISGGHTELVLSRNWMQYELLGATRDDAVGEAFDKVARLLGLPYPGGPEISRIAATSRSRGLTSEVSFTPPMLRSNDYDFSFSGLKTEVRKFVDGKELDDTAKMQIARAFEDAVATVLVSKTTQAAKEFGAASVLVGGGVSANTFIRQKLADATCKAPAFTKLLVPPADLATDNALMIALAGYFHALKKDYADPATLRADGNLKLH